MSLVKKENALRNAVDLRRPSPEERKRHINETKAAIDRLIATKIEGSDLKIRESRKQTVELPDRKLTIVAKQKDPLEPPVHKFRKTMAMDLVSVQNRAPITRLPPKQLSKEEKAEWHIPQSISNWKNSKGYMLDRAKNSTSRSSNSLDSVNKRLDLATALAEAEELVAQTNLAEEKATKEQQRLKLKLLAQKNDNQADEMLDSRLFHNSSRTNKTYDSELFTSQRAKTKASLRSIKFDPAK